MSKRRTLILTATLALLASPAAQADPGAVTNFKGACSPSESWTLSSNIREDIQRDFRALVSKSDQPVLGFANALSYRRFAVNEETRALAEYWIARALYQSQLYHVAQNGFAVIASRPVTPETANIQLAATECMLRIAERYPTLELPQRVYARLAEQDSRSPVVWEAAHRLLRLQLSEEKPKAQEIEKTLSLLAANPAYDSFGKALWAARRNEFSKAIKEMKRYFEVAQVPVALKQYNDLAHLTYARALYGYGDYDRAAEQYKLIKKNSNELAESLQELSWSFLMSERYSEAIGTAMNLQAGGLRHTFAPEAPMVMAMAMNEICQYPESVKATNVFRKNYEDPYKWLSRWKAQGKDSHLYPMLLEFLRKQGKTPVRVASEWVRSPIFISSQDEINLLNGEVSSSVKLGKSGSSLQRQIGREIVQLIMDIKPKLKAAKAKRKNPDEPLPSSLTAKLITLKSKLIAFRRMQNGAPVWRTILASHQKSVQPRYQTLIAQIEKDLVHRNDRMLEQLEEVAENLQLVEVEIYNGASQDIIWQNAHPEYKKMANKLGADREPASADKVWDWGRTASFSEETSEIWEDELGSFKADLPDNCGNKDRFLALKAKENGR